MSDLKEICLFAGAGGGALGSRLLDNKIIAYVEWNDDCQKILKARIRDGVIDDAPIFSDIRDFDGTAWAGKVDLITGGFPCQPFSSAGKQLKENDPRNMWPDTKRILSQARPTWALLENVEGLLKSGYFHQVLFDLSEIGYDAFWVIISAADVGALHMRKRLWIICRKRGSFLENAKTADFGWGEIYEHITNMNPAMVISPTDNKWKTTQGMIRNASISVLIPNCGLMSDGTAWFLPRKDVNVKPMKFFPTPTVYDVAEQNYGLSWSLKNNFLSKDHQISIGKIERLKETLFYAYTKGILKKENLGLFGISDIFSERNMGNSSHFQLKKIFSFLKMNMKELEKLEAFWKDIFLNPEWIESIMGWPLGYTSNDPMRKNDITNWQESFLSGNWPEQEPQRTVIISHEKCKNDVNVLSSRIKMLGNGQVPLCVVAAWKLLERGYDYTGKDKFDFVTRSKIMSVIREKEISPRNMT